MFNVDRNIFIGILILNLLCVFFRLLSLTEDIYLIPIKENSPRKDVKSLQSVITHNEKVTVVFGVMYNTL